MLEVISGILHPSQGNVLPKARISPDAVLIRSCKRVSATFLRTGRFSRASRSCKTSFWAVIIGEGIRQRSFFDFVFNLFPILKERVKQKAGTLSGGEQQTLAISRGLISRPRLLDEPSLGLAPMIVKEIFRVIQDLRLRGTSILLVEQNVIRALNVSDRGYIIENGKIATQGKPAILQGDDEVRRRYLGK
jgi:branched-chain amino acid transport system ATP-binding protein